MNPYGTTGIRFEAHFCSYEKYAWSWSCILELEQILVGDQVLDLVQLLVLVQLKQILHQVKFLVHVVVHVLDLV